MNNVKTLETEHHLKAMYDFYIFVKDPKNADCSDESLRKLDNLITRLQGAEKAGVLTINYVKLKEIVCNMPYIDGATKPVEQRQVTQQFFD